MGMDSKILEYPGVAEVFASLRTVFGTKRDLIACPTPSQCNAGKTMGRNNVLFLFLSGAVKQPLGWAGMGKMPGGL
jgi:hypothetical protein